MKDSLAIRRVLGRKVVSRYAGELIHAYRWNTGFSFSGDYLHEWAGGVKTREVLKVTRDAGNVERATPLKTEKIAGKRQVE